VVTQSSREAGRQLTATRPSQGSSQRSCAPVLNKPPGVGRLTLLAEDLRHITRRDAASHLTFKHSPDFRNAVVSGERRGKAFLSTETRDNGVIINVHGDGGSRGRPQTVAAARVGRTILSSVSTNESPTILAAKREMQTWRRLALEPTALRALILSGTLDHSQQMVATSPRRSTGSLTKVRRRTGRAAPRPSTGE